MISVQDKLFSASELSMGQAFLQEERNFARVD